MKIEAERLAGVKVVDKIDLSQFDKKKKKKKRERIGKEGSQKVDVTKVEASNNAAKKDKKDKNNHPGAQQQAAAFARMRHPRLCQHDLQRRPCYRDPHTPDALAWQERRTGARRQ